MATRIDPGRMQLRGVGGVPMQQVTPREVDFIGFRAEAQAANTLSQLVDRMSQTAFQMAETAVKERAMVDVASMPLSPEQLDMASRGDMSFLKSGNQFNIYDVTMRKARSMELAGHFDTEAKGEVIKIMADVENGIMNSEQAANKINTLTNGFASSLAKVDADAALKFTAQMGVYSNTVMSEAYKLDRKRKKDRDLAMLAADFENTKVLLERTFAQGFFTDSAGNIVPAEVVATQHINDFLRKADLAGEGAAYMPKAAEAIKNAKIDVVSAYVGNTEFAPSANSAISRLDKNDAGKMTEIWATMNFEDKAKVRSNLRTLQIERQAAKDQDEKDALQADTIRVAELTSQFFQTGNRSVLTELRAISVRNPKAITPEAVHDLPSKRNSGEQANPRAEYILKTEILQGMHPDTASLESRAREMGIGYKRLSENLLPFFITRDNEQERDVERVFRTASRIVPGQFNISQRQNAAYAKLTADLERQYPKRVQDARAAGKPAPTRLEVARDIVNQRQTSQQQDVIDRNLRELNDQFGVNGTVKKTGIVFTVESDYNEIASQAARLGLKSDFLANIRQRMDIVRQKQNELDAQ